MEEIRRSSKHTVLCSKCGRRNSKAGKFCIQCGETLHIPGILDVLIEIWFNPMTTLKRYYHWTHHMGIPHPRMRGVVRGILSLIFGYYGMILVMNQGSPEFGSGLLLLGFASSSSASVELVCNRNFFETSGCLRIVLMTFSTLLYFVFIGWLLFGSL